MTYDETSTRPVRVRSLLKRIARHNRLTHALEQTITNIVYAVLIGAICVVLFS